jgi:hypothetical protein
MAMDSEMVMAGGDPPPFPLRFDVEYPQKLSRLLIFVKWLLAIPHLIVVYLLGYVLSLLTFIAFFAILFTKQYPEALFNFVVGIQRWTFNTYAYVGLLRDEYPPFSFDSGQYPVNLDVERAPELSRWLIFIKWLLVIPNLIVLAIVGIAAFVVTIIAWFAILFTGSYPRGMFDFVVGAMRWSARANAYTYLWTDRYPPFSLK